MSLQARCDFETRSEVDIDRGLWHYTHGKDAAVLCLAYALPGDAEPRLWKPGTPNPQDLFDHLAQGGTFAAWNCNFEYFVWNYICTTKYGWPPLRIEQCVDTMAQAAAANLPQSLAGCGEALGLAQDKLKSKRGKELIKKLCVPQRLTQTRQDIWNNDPALLEELYQYCRQDVVAEAEIAQLLRPLTPHEQEVWVATQKINLRGLPVAVDEIAPTVAVIEAEKQRLNDELKTVTRYAVTAATQRDQLQTWVNGLIPTPKLIDLTAETVEATLKRTDLPPQVRRALEIRQRVSLTSTAKHEVLLDTAAPDGTVKNLLTYHGASTGRWASRGGLNAQNLGRPTLSKLDVHTAHEVLPLGDHSVAHMIFGDQLMDAAASTVRGVIKAPKGFEFIDADWSSVENRVGAWIAGQQDKLDMFAAGLDEYRVFASSSLYGVPYDMVTADQRQVSKSAVLGCMFGQGAVGLTTFAKGYGVELTQERSKEIVDAYRAEYRQVAKTWWSCGDAIINAVQSPRTTIKVGPMSLRCDKGALWMKLPSGRLIAWQSPLVEMLDTPWGEKKLGVSYMGVDRFTRKWSRCKLIGSSVFQSAVQGTARDLMADALLRLESAGYPIVLLVHDEFLSLVPRKQGNEEEFIQIMCQAPAWAEGLPLAAEAWRGIRYRK